MIRFIVELDARGLVQVEIIALAEEHEQAHKVWEAIRSQVENLGAVVHRLTKAPGELGRRNRSGEGTGHGNGSHQ